MQRRYTYDDYAVDLARFEGVKPVGYEIATGVCRALVAEVLCALQLALVEDAPEHVGARDTKLK